MRSTFFVVKNKPGEIHIVISKKIAKTSVLRHRLKRKVIGAIGPKSKFQGILIAQPALLNATPAELKHDIEKITSGLH